MTGTRILSPLRLPFRHGAEEADSTGDTAILQAIRDRDWERLGGLLGAFDSHLGAIVSRWPLLPKPIRDAMLALSGAAIPNDGQR